MMPDREKVIRALENALVENKNQRYESVRFSFEVVEIIIDLLKEQEAVEPYIAGSGESFETAETWWYECGNCNKPIDPNDKFCRHCGRSVKWE